MPRSLEEIGKDITARIVDYKSNTPEYYNTLQRISVEAGNEDSHVYTSSCSRAAQIMRECINNPDYFVKYPTAVSELFAWQKRPKQPVRIQNHIEIDENSLRLAELFQENFGKTTTALCVEYMEAFGKNELICLGLERMVHRHLFDAMQEVLKSIHQNVLELSAYELLEDPQLGQNMAESNARKGQLLVGYWDVFNELKSFQGNAEVDRLFDDLIQQLQTYIDCISMNHNLPDNDAKIYKNLEEIIQRFKPDPTKVTIDRICELREHLRDTMYAITDPEDGVYFRRLRDVFWDLVETPAVAKSHKLE